MFMVPMISGANQNPKASEKPPISTNPTDCKGKDAQSWCRSGQDEAIINQARSAQAKPVDGPIIRFGGVKGKNIDHSALKPSH